MLWFAADAGVLKPSIRALQSGTSQLVVGSALLTGLPAQAGPQAVVSFGAGSFSYWISEGCTAWAAGLLYVSAVLAYPARWRQRGYGILIGLPLVFALNVVRLVSMAWLGVRWPSLYEQAHGVWWQAMVILAVGFGWLAWARYVEAERQGRRILGGARELGVAVLIFWAAIATFEVVGASAGLIEAYGSAVMAVSSALIRMAGVQSDFWFPNPTFHYSILYGAAAAAAALYLAAPRVPIRDRVFGAAVWGLPSQFLLDALALGLRKAVLAGEIHRADDAYLFGQILTMGGSAVVWYLWARRRWILALDAMGRYRCPACKASLNELVGHIETVHAAKAQRWRKAAFKAYPELRGQRGHGDE